MRTPVRKVLGTGAGIVILALAAWGIGSWVRAPRLTPELRGYDVALRLGCFGCHGAGGTGGVPNPGSDEKEVPAWDGGTAMMYVESESEIREWIVDGRPARLAEKYSEERTERELPFSMPAYGNVVGARDLDDLVAYYKAVARYGSMPARAREGHRVASRLGCFGCHGPGGLVGAENPRSFKGYIPPWRGADYRELVQSEDELEGWIRDGGVERIESNAAARWFLRRQIVSMPAYRDHITDEELEALVTYILWLQ